jgi:hypothetical protein
MQIEGPERYELTFTPETFSALCAKGTKKFSGLSTTELPKLYIASIDDKPIYVGMTKQSIRARLRFGWNAKGKGGYHGYAWRHGNSSAVLDVWCHVDAIDRNERDIETVEADPRCRAMARVSNRNSFLSVLAAASRSRRGDHEPLQTLVGH